MCFSESQNLLVVFYVWSRVCAYLQANARACASDIFWIPCSYCTNEIDGEKIKASSHDGRVTYFACGGLCARAMAKRIPNLRMILLVSQTHCSGTTLRACLRHVIVWFFFQYSHGCHPEIAAAWASRKVKRKPWWCWGKYRKRRMVIAIQTRTSWVLRKLVKPEDVVLLPENIRTSKTKNV